MPFTKGDPNINRNGRPRKENCVTDILKQKLPPDKLAELLTEQALKGNNSIIQHIYDRYEGKVPDKHEITGDDGGELNINVNISKVDK